MSQLGLIAFGGNTHDGPAGTDPVVEVWECTLAASVEDSGVFTQSRCDTLAALIETWFANVDSGMSTTETLEYVKWNEYSLATGHQLTDPTLQTLVTGVRGSLTTVQPVSTSVRISLDDGTRNPRAKGGFYPPRLGRQVGASGRISSSDQTGMMTQALILLNGISADLNAWSPGSKLGVWSRRDHLVHISTRLRIGNVPDNISRRRNHLRETYFSASL